MLGNYLKNYLNKYKIIQFTRENYNLELLSIDSLEILLNNYKIDDKDIVINCAGIIPQTQNYDKEKYYKINSIFPIVLSMLCNKINCNMIHITSNCIFDGKDCNYNETSIFNETNDYEISKYLSEISNCTIIRTSIIGEEIYNKRSLLEWVISNKNKEINGYINHYWNGVTCLELSKIIEYMIINNIYWKGVKHIFSPNIISKYELLLMINDIYNLNIKINKIETIANNKTLSSIYVPFYIIKDIKDQIIEQKHFNLS